MAITRPITRTIISTTDWGIPITDEVNRITAAVARMGGHYRRAANQSIPNQTTTTMSWDTELSDTENRTTVPFTTYTIGTGGAGVYGMYACVWLGGEGGTISLTVSGLAGIGGASGRGNAVNGWASVFCMWPMVVGDGCSVQVWQNTGAALNALGVFSIFRMSL